MVLYFKLTETTTVVVHIPMSIHTSIIMYDCVVYIPYYVHGGVSYVPITFSGTTPYHAQRSSLIARGVKLHNTALIYLATVQI